MKTRSANPLSQVSRPPIVGRNAQEVAPALTMIAIPAWVRRVVIALLQEIIIAYTGLILVLVYRY